MYLNFGCWSSKSSNLECEYAYADQEVVAYYYSMENVSCSPLSIPYSYTRKWQTTKCIFLYMYRRENVFYTLCMLYFPFKPAVQRKRYFLTFKIKSKMLPLDRFWEECNLIKCFRYIRYINKFNSCLIYV